MNEQLMQVICVAAAGIAVMIIHELPKSIVYICSPSGRHSSHRSRVFLLYNYIDPIGLLFCVTSLAGFSRPYMFRIKEKRTNFKLGITGFVTLSGVFCISMIFLMGMQPQNAAAFQWMPEGERTLVTFLYCLAYVSFGMLLVNLFPVSTFDMGLLIAGKSPSKYLAIIQGDAIVKTILIFSILMGVVPSISGMVVRAIVLLG